MLSHGDAAVADRDRRVPGLSLVLDEDGLADALRRALPAGAVDRVRVTYLRYKPRTDCVAALRIRSAEAETDAYAKAHRGGEADKVAKVIARAVPLQPWGPGAVRLDEDVAVSFFPNDRRLAVHGVLSDPVGRRRLLRRLLPHRPDAWDGRLRTLRYKPERRYVGRLDGPAGPAAVLRCYGPREFERAAAAAQAFATQRGVRVARLLGVVPEYRILACEWLEPDRSGGATGGRRPAGFDRAVGEALAALHQQPVTGLDPLPREEEITRLREAAAAVAAVAPSTASRARRLVGRLTAALADLPPRSVPIHGDFSDDQVVVTRDGIAIVDHDSARLGDAAADLGLYVARVVADGIGGQDPVRQGAPRTRALLTGYRSAAGATTEALARVDLYTSVWLLRLAAEPFRLRAAGWPRRVAGMLECAGRWAS